MIEEIKNKDEELLSKKTIEQLGIILNACQRFELNNISPLVVKILAQQMLVPAHRDACLKNGSYGLALTADSKKLILQALRKNNNFMPRIATWLTFLHFDGLFEYHHFVEVAGGVQNIRIRCNSFSKIPFNNNTCFLSEVEPTMQQNIVFALILASSRTRDVIVSLVKHEGPLDLYYWEVLPFFRDLYENKLTIEQIAFLHFALEKLEKNETFSVNKFPKMEEIFRTLPKYVQQALISQSSNRILLQLMNPTNRTIGAFATLGLIGFGLYKWMHK